MEPRRETMSVSEAGAILGICRNAAYKLASQGVIPTLRLGRRLVVPRRALAKMLRNPRPRESREEEQS